MLDHHTHLWPHEPGNPPPTIAQLEQYCEAADRAGVRQLAITEHGYRFTRIAEEILPHWERTSTGPVAQETDRIIAQETGGDLDAYVDVLVSAQDQGLPILVGLEIDYMPGAMEATADLLAEYPLDIVLGSVHWLDCWLFDAYGIETFAAEWETRDTDAVYAGYVDAVLALAESGVADVLAHLDVIKVAGYLPDNLPHHEQRLVDGLRGTDMAIEFSSAGLRKPVNATYPSSDLLDLVVAAGLPLTTASDGHTVEQIGAGMDTLAAELDRRGIDTLRSYRRRQPELYRRRG